MTTMSVSLRSIPDTRAALGWAGGHTVVIDRPEGRAGGMGLGFNGGQMIALSIGGCFCNDLRYVAEEMGVDLDTVEVDVTIELEGQPQLVTHATMSVGITTRTPGADLDEVVRRAEAISAVTNSVRAGFPVTVVAE